MEVVDYRLGNTVSLLAKRHFRSMVGALSPIKATNALKFLASFFAKSSHCMGNPFYIKIEPTNVCDHKCHGCGSQSARPKGYLKLERYKEIIDAFKPWSLRTCLYGQGESFLHPHIFDMISYSQRQNSSVSISSNFNCVEGRKIEQLLDSGLDYLIVCIDGATQLSHSRHRVGGNLQKVLQNMKTLANLRDRKGYKRPFIEVQTINFDYTRDEQEKIRILCSEHGADRQFIRENMYSPSIKREPLKSCAYLWGSLFFSWEGLCYPCEEFLGSFKGFDWQNQADLVAFWNSRFLAECRFVVKSKDSPHVVDEIRCTNCFHFINSEDK